MCERPSEEDDIIRFMHMLVPIGLQPYDREQSRDVAVILSKALDYRNVELLFTEDTMEP